MSDEISVDNVRKEIEYRAFIKLIGDSKIPPHWNDVADAIGVHPNTISKWKKLPEFQKAIADGIDESIKQMASVGKRDWRMWRERYGLLVREQKKQEGTTINNLVGAIQININGAENDK